MFDLNKRVRARQPLRVRKGLMYKWCAPQHIGIAFCGFWLCLLVVHCAFASVVRSFLMQRWFPVLLCGRMLVWFAHSFAVCGNAQRVVSGRCAHSGSALSIPASPRVFIPQQCSRGRPPQGLQVARTKAPAFDNLFCQDRHCCLLLYRQFSDISRRTTIGLQNYGPFWRLQELDKLYNAPDSLHEQQKAATRKGRAQRPT